ncbi:MAG: signal peptidase I [Candidatus Pacebacteria bacterium]|nr:signal peptidase I [Candidatus Paceibacterota bacterium]MBP9839626.1 signal peptidase I [Candidatus Paceibacterota bacterium]
MSRYMEEQNQEIKAETATKTTKESFWELVRFAILAILIVLPIRIFIAQPFIVSGASMYPTFHDSEYLIIDEISYILGEPKRNDVVVFKYPKDTKKFFIKRIIGLPGETVDVNGEEVTITNKENKEGFKLDQSYVENKSNTTGHYVLEDDEYFVMGDNRSASSDSRYWGPVKENLLVGRALVRLLPISKIDFMPGHYKEQ